jgi:GT2 family glycosyltransferase
MDNVVTDKGVTHDGVTDDGSAAVKGDAAPPGRADVAVVILTLNQREKVLRLLRSFSPGERAAVKWVVWDNGSDDGTVDAVRSEFPGVHAHWNPANLGVASGRNAGAALAIEQYDPAYLAFIDNDIVVTPGFLDALRAPLDADPTIGQTQAKLRLMDQPDRINDGGGCQVSFWRGLTRPIGIGEVDVGQYDTPRPCISGGGMMMVRTSLFRRLGGFDSAFDPVGPEDLDFSLRLQRLGYVALYTPTAVAYHEVGHTYSGARYNRDYARIKARNWLHFMGRHGSTVEKLGFFAVGVPLIVLRLLGREVRRGNVGALIGSVGGVFESVRRKRA